MAELATVRAEIKAWERSFKDANGQAPTVDDIKQNPEIADKYKQYKKLSKAVAPMKHTQTAKPAAPPSTPPRTTRPKEPPSLLLSKSRPVQPSAPLAAFNPFSPQKKQKGKEREKIAVDRKDESRSNPFGKSQPAARARKQSHSPDPFPPIPQSQTSSSASPSHFLLNPLPAPTSAVSRARKRLRGEPVSPSPNKDKRRRVTSQTTLAFPRLNLDAPSSEDGEDDFMEANSSFVDDSPVKTTTTGKSYPQLFEETEILVPVDLFGTKANLEITKQDTDEPRNKSQKILNGTGRTKAPARRTSTSKSIVADSASKPLEHPNLRTISKLPSRLSDRNAGNSKSEVSSNRSSVKRAFSDEEVVEKPLPRAKSPLIPPSPPPSGSNPPFNQSGKNKAKAKASTGRKKAKVDDKVDEDSDNQEMHESQAKLRIVSRNTMRRQHAAAGPDEDAVTSDSDPILGYARFATPHVSSQTHHAQQEGGDVEIDLPDKLRRVLALQSADSKTQVSEEDRLVKGLLYGRRMAHYDPHKGGEIWDVGEDRHEDGNEGQDVYTEGEDDWEGEPVPWEVGEL